MSQDLAKGSSQQVQEKPRPGALARSWDSLGILLCLVVAFCATLFPARNHDVFLFLAGGQQLVNGTYDFSKDPFVYTNPNGYVNHNWLYSIVLYLIHQIQTLGPSLLIIIKALGAVCTVILIAKSVRLPLGRLTVPILALGLMALGISNRWLLQPFALSAFFLAATLYLLSHLEGESAEDEKHWGLAYFCLPLLFTLWVNCDIWFFVGPLAVTVYCTARIVSGNSRLSPVSVVALIGLSWAVCLINPWGFKAFQVPMNIRFYDESLKGWREIYQQWFSSTISQTYLQPHIGFNLSGLAFFPLALLGLIFAISGRSQKSLSYIAIFAVFLVMGLAFSRTLPFFCIAGAWATLGLCLNREPRPSEAPRSASAKGLPPQPFESLVFPKVGLCFLLVLAVAFAIPGWIHPRHTTDDRAFGLGIIPDESLKNLSLWIKEKKEKGEWDDTKQLFHMSPELPGYLAWFAPGTKGFIDYRLSLSHKAANDFYQMHAALMGRKNQVDEAFKLDDWKEILRSWDVGYVVFQEGVGHGLEQIALDILLSHDRRRWSVLRVEGTTLTLALKTPADADKPAPEDPKSLAFGAEASRVSDAPEFKEPVFSVWKALFADNIRYGPKDYEALHRLTQFRTERRATEEWLNTQLAGLAVSASSPQAMANLATWTGACAETYLSGRPNQVAEMFEFFGTQTIEDADPAYLYLCIRAARQALAIQPNDPKALLFLGQAYELLNTASLERRHFQVANGLNAMAMIRRYQAYAALNKAARNAQSIEDKLVLNPLLMRTYERTYPEVTLSYLKSHIEVIQTRLVNLPPAERVNLANRLQNNLTGLENEIRSRQDKFENAAIAIEKQSPNISAFRKAQSAFREFRLIQTAKENIDSLQSREQIALDSTRKLLRETTKLNLEILLTLGEADAAGEALTEDYKDQLEAFPNFDLPAYQWFNVLIAAAQGRYQVADAFIKECIQPMLGRKQGFLSNLRDLTFGFPKKDQFTRFSPLEMASLNCARTAMMGTTAIQGPSALFSTTYDFRLGRPVLEGIIQEDTILVQGLLQFQGYLYSNHLLSEMEVCRGFLSLEAGDVSAAKQAFTRSLEYSPAGPSNFIVRKFLSKIP